MEDIRTKLQEPGYAIRKRDNFHSYQELENILNAREELWNEKFVKKQARLVSASNLVNKTILYRPELQYVSVQLQCTHYGTYELKAKSRKTQ